MAKQQQQRGDPSPCSAFFAAMTGPLDLRFEIDAAERPPLDSVPNGCDHGGAASLRSGNRHRCVEKTCERRGGEPNEYVNVKSSL